MRLGSILVGGALLIGCSFERLGLGPGDEADAPAGFADAPPGTPDADPNVPVPDAPVVMIDAAVPVPDASPPDATVCTPWPWTPVNLDPCDLALPPATTSLVLPAASDWELYILDTTDGSLTTPGGVVTLLPSALLPQTDAPDLRVFPLAMLDVGAFAYVLIIGDYPAVFVVHGSATVDGAIDVSALYFIDMGVRYSIPGPGADHPTACASSFGTNGTDSTGAGGAGGGGGGGFRGDGGDGGDGQGGGSGNKGSKGGSSGTNTLIPLRGGCSGGDGGNPLGSLVDFGWRGHGAGALGLAVRDTLTINGWLLAAGEEGHSGSAGDAGGGGGGSGGAILVEADDLTISATAAICANGGSGAEGWGNSTAGAEGQGGTCSEVTRATTLAVADNGGNGGAGGYAGSINGTNATDGSSGGAGGGGGGSAGRIRLRGVTSETVDATSIISPSDQP